MKDFLYHLFACFVCAVFVGLMLLGMDATGLAVIIGGGLAGLCLGIGKEFGDMAAPGNKWSWSDFLADCIGVIIGMALLLLIVVMANVPVTIPLTTNPTLMI